MECTFKLKPLKQSVNFLQKAIPSKPQLPILSSILLEINENSVTFSATDLFLGIQTTLPAEVKEQGKASIPGDIFRQIIHSLHQESTVSLKLKDNSLLLKAGKNKSKLAMQSVEDYPAFPEIEGQSFTLSREILSNIQQYIAFVASTDQTRPVLTAILMQFSQDNLRSVATDGFRLAVLDQTITGIDKDYQFLFPAKALTEIVKIAEKLDQQQIKFVVSDELKQVKCLLGKTTLYIRLIEGEYPPYEKIMPSDFLNSVSLDKQDFDDQLKRAALFSKDISNIVKLHLEQEKMTVTASSPAIGSYEGELNLMEKLEQTQDIAFNVHYLSEFLQAIDSEIVIFEMNESLKPARFRLKELTNWQYIVMPFRVNS